MKKLVSVLAVAAFVFTITVNAQEPTQEKKKAKTEKTCSSDKKGCSSEKKSCGSEKKVDVVHLKKQRKKAKN